MEIFRFFIRRKIVWMAATSCDGFSFRFFFIQNGTPSNQNDSILKATPIFPNTLKYFFCLTAYKWHSINRKCSVKDEKEDETISRLFIFLIWLLSSVCATFVLCPDRMIQFVLNAIKNDCLRFMWINGDTECGTSGICQNEERFCIDAAQTELFAFIKWHSYCLVYINRIELYFRSFCSFVHFHVARKMATKQSFYEMALRKAHQRRWFVDNGKIEINLAIWLIHFIFACSFSSEISCCSTSTFQFDWLITKKKKKIRNVVEFRNDVLPLRQNYVLFP